MSTPESSLPERWVERIFAAMRANYGASFDRQWEPPAGLDEEGLREHARQQRVIWGRGLARLQQSPESIEYGLSNLPPHPPSLPEFRGLCLSRRSAEALPRALPAPKNPPPADVLQRVAKVGQVRRDGRAWAYALRDGHQRGERLTQFQIACYTEALSLEPTEVQP